MAAKKGPLETKLKPRLLPLLVSEAEQLKVIEGWRNEDYEKLLLLCDVMGIADTPHRFFDLSLALARKHYAGFQQVGPSSKWTDLTRGYLVVEIERLTAEGHDAKAAARMLAGRPEWKSFSRAGRGGEGLRVQYQDFKNDRWASVMRDAFRLYEYQDRLSEWNDNLVSALEKPHPDTYL
jgi:hypothetical protein